jgi:chemotaxis protein MotB
VSQTGHPPIIIIKKKKGHGGHHGGAWKVAYADFVTAMMAFFMVMWLMGSSAKVKEAVSSYFKDPSGVGKDSGSGAAGSGETLSVTHDNMDDLKEQLEQAFKKSPEFEKMKDYVQMSVTGDGLRIELLESEQGMFFQSGSPSPSDTGEQLIIQMAEQLGQLPNQLLIEGHTDSRPLRRKEYSNWELSTDRANSARRIMEEHGLRPGQVLQVRGFADQNLREKDDPEAASNRRVSVIVRYLPADPAPPAEKEKEGEAKAQGGEKPKPAEGEHH